MLGFVKKIILTNKQNLINRRFPNVNIVLHPDLSSPSINEMVGLAKIVNAVNSLEPKISALSDMQLRRKTEEFKEHILKKSKVYESEILELEEALLSVAIPEETLSTTQKTLLAVL